MKGRGPPLLRLKLRRHPLAHELFPAAPAQRLSPPQGSNGDSDKWVHDVAIKQVGSAGTRAVPD